VKDGCICNGGGTGRFSANKEHVETLVFIPRSVNIVSYYLKKKIDNSYVIINMLVFCDGATVCLSTLVNQYNVQAWEVKKHISHLGMKVKAQNLCSDIGRHSLWAVPFYLNR
jgi:hypothetical protein